MRYGWIDRAALLGSQPMNGVVPSTEAWPGMGLMPQKCALFGLLLWGLSWPLAAQTVPEQVAEANRLYREGKFDQAKKEYLAALKRRPELPELHFNLGDALYKSQDYQEARESFRESLREAPPELQANAWYNLGNALFRQGQMEESLEAFKESLRLNPSDAEAKHNLEFVLKQMQEQQQDQSSDDQQQQDDQEQDDQQQEQQQQQDQNQQQSDQNQNQDEESSQSEQDQNEQSEPEQQEQPQPSESESPAEQEPGEEPPPSQGGAPDSAQQMSREDVQRILDALKEDPEQFLKRKVVKPARLKVKKDW